MNPSLNPPLRLLSAFQKSYPDVTADWIVRASGREMWIAASIRHTGKYTILTPDLDSETSFDRRSARSKRTTNNRPLSKWARYPAGVLMILATTGLDIPGLEAVIVGEEPAGPRYHYSLGMAMASLCYEYHERDVTSEQLIELMERVRRDYIEA